LPLPGVDLRLNQFKLLLRCDGVFGSFLLAFASDFCLPFEPGLLRLDCFFECLDALRFEAAFNGRCLLDSRNPRPDALCIVGSRFRFVCSAHPCLVQWPPKGCAAQPLVFLWQ
jgi:hypothetical protein